MNQVCNTALPALRRTVKRTASASFSTGAVLSIPWIASLARVATSGFASRLLRRIGVARLVDGQLDFYQVIICPNRTFQGIVLNEL